MAVDHTPHLDVVANKLQHIFKRCIIFPVFDTELKLPADAAPKDSAAKKREARKAAQQMSQSFMEQMKENEMMEHLAQMFAGAGADAGAGAGFDSASGGAGPSGARKMDAQMREELKRMMQEALRGHSS